MALSQRFNLKHQVYAIEGWRLRKLGRVGLRKVVKLKEAEEVSII